MNTECVWAGKHVHTYVSKLFIHVYVAQAAVSKVGFNALYMCTMYIYIYYCMYYIYNIQYRCVYVCIYIYACMYVK